MGRSERDGNGQLRCPTCRFREMVLSDYPRRCPVCDESAMYVPSLDRFVHLDGSANEACWIELSRAAS